MCEFMDKMLKANKKTLIREVEFTHAEIKNMSLDDIEKNARQISSEANWKDRDAEKLFEYKVLETQAPSVLEKARGQ